LTQELSGNAGGILPADTIWSYLLSII